MPRHRHPKTFVDAANAEGIPSGLLAAVYVNTDGSFAWDQEDVDRCRGVFGISESTDPAFAEYARCIAVEPGAGTPPSVINFLRNRREHGHSDGMCYVNLSNWEQTERDVINAGERCVWWVAHPGDPNPGALRSPIKGERPVAVQTHWGTAYDTSVILGTIEFTPPAHFHATG